MSSSHTWSKDLDYQTEIDRLKKLVIEEKRILQKAYYAIFLTQLSQSMRLSEATDAMLKWAKEPKEINHVQVKTRKRKSVYWRDVFIPKTILDNSSMIKRGLNELEYSDQLVNTIGHYVRRHLYNSHALRHAAITHQGEMNIPAQVIAKGTGHVRAEQVSTYTQRTAIVKVLKEMASEA